MKSPDAPDAPAAPATFLEALREALWEEMEDDERVFLLGEDIATYGGAFKLTQGFAERFGASRVIDTPIAEAGIVGAAIGAAIMGMRPVAEMQFLDFISCGFDQLTNFAAKVHYRWGQPVPIVVRGPGGAAGGGPFHSQSVEMYFIKTPGIKVVEPSTAADAKLLLKAAIRDPNPVLFIEHKGLYRAPALREVLPGREAVGELGKAAIRRDGNDLAVITYGAMVHKCLEAAEQIAREDAAQVRVLDLRTLQPMDDAAIFACVRECSRVLIVHEDTRTAGLAGEITARINENAFEWLDAPIRRVTALDTPVPYNKNLEAAFLPQVTDIVREARALLAY